MVEGGWCGRVIIVSALSLSLRDKDRFRDRESLTTAFTGHFGLNRKPAFVVIEKK